MPERDDDTPEARETPDAAPAGDRPDVADTVPDAATDGAATGPGRPREIGGQQGPEPTRYGDWEGKGRCTDF